MRHLLIAAAVAVIVLLVALVVVDFSPGWVTTTIPIVLPALAFVVVAFAMRGMPDRSPKP